MSRARRGLLALGTWAPAFALPALRVLGDEPSRATDSRREERLARTLDAQLLGLSVGAFERLVAQILVASGYEEVQVLRDHGKDRRSHKGRTEHGGADLSAALRAEFGVTRVLAQAKQYERPVSRRFVDELRGALLRSGASQGVLVTTSAFPRAARQAALEDRLAPVHLVDGAHLRALLVAHGLGVKRNRRGRLVVRRRFFRRLDVSPPVQEKAS